MGDDGWICWKRKGRIVELMVYYVETNSNSRIVSTYVEIKKSAFGGFQVNRVTDLYGRAFFGSFKTSGGCYKKPIYA